MIYTPTTKFTIFLFSLFVYLFIHSYCMLTEKIFVERQTSDINTVLSYYTCYSSITAIHVHTFFFVSITSKNRSIHFSSIQALIPMVVFYLKRLQIVNQPSN